MSAILNIKIPFFRRKTSGGSNGIATFYLGSVPKYLPTLGQVCMIVHTNVPAGSGLSNKLTSMSTNVVTGKFQSYEELASQETIDITDQYKNFFVIEYEDHSFSINQFSGDCAGYISYDVNPSTYEILKPVENVAIVNENVPYDMDEGYSELWCATGTTTPFTNDIPPVFPGMMVRLKDNNTIFANVLKSLNLPVSDEDLKKYTRSGLGKLTEATNSTDPYDVIMDGRKYKWTAITTNTTDINLVTHPVTGHTGEYYNTVLQSVGSVDDPVSNAVVPYQNQVVLIFEIPQSFYGEIIDGKTIGLTLPFWNKTAAPVDGVYTYDNVESTINIYASYNKNGANLDSALSERDLSLTNLGSRPDLDRPISDYESNTALLFSNIVRKPKNNVNKDWGAGHTEVIDGVKVFDAASVTPKEPYDYNQDRCVGVAYLDKGFIAITHPEIVDSIFTKAFGGTITLNNGIKSYNFNSPAVGNTRSHIATNNSIVRTVNSSNEIEWDNTQWVFTTTSASTTVKLEYISYNSEKSLNIVCLASADEFYKSSNPTAKELLGVPATEDFANFKSEDSNLYPIMITQLGIHDAQGNLLAVCKPTQPVKKYWFDVSSFNIKIRL